MVGGMEQVLFVKKQTLQGNKLSFGFTVLKG